MTVKRDVDLDAAVDRALDRALGPLAGRATATVDEVAERIGVSRSAAFDAVRRGDLPSCRVGRRVLVPVPALTALLLDVETKGTSSNGGGP